MGSRLTSVRREDFTTDNYANCLRVSTGYGFPGRQVSLGAQLGSGWGHDDEVIEVRTAKFMLEERRWQAERDLLLDALLWLLRSPRVKRGVIPRKRRHITLNYIRKNAGTLECKACTVDPTHHKKKCSERFQTIFERQAAEAAAAAAVARSLHDARPPGECEQWSRPPVVCSEAGETPTSGIPSQAKKFHHQPRRRANRKPN